MNGSSDTKSMLAEFESAYGYRFQDPEKIVLAFQDPSLFDLSQDVEDDGRLHNRRLEYLGDAVILLVVRSYQQRYFPDVSVNLVAKYVAHCVSNLRLSKVAINVRIHRFVRFKAADDGDLSRKQMASALEAVVGAIFQDGGYQCAEQFCFRWVIPHFPPPTNRVEYDPVGLLHKIERERGIGKAEYIDTKTIYGGKPYHHVVVRYAGRSASGDSPDYANAKFFAVKLLLSRL